MHVMQVVTLLQISLIYINAIRISPYLKKKKLKINYGLTKFIHILTIAHHMPG